MSVSTQLGKDGKTLILTVEGRFDESLHRAFREAYAAYAPDLHYVVDLSRVEQLDSSALGLILLLRSHAGGDAARVTLRGVPDGARGLLELSRFDKLFEMV